MPAESLAWFDAEPVACHEPDRLDDSGTVDGKPSPCPVIAAPTLMQDCLRGISVRRTVVRQAANPE